MSIHVVTGTDTGIGKTVFAAGLAAALGAHYWKPIQAGVEPDGDKEEVARLSGLPASHILPEAYRLNTPASPISPPGSTGWKSRSTNSPCRRSMARWS